MNDRNRPGRCTRERGCPILVIRRHDTRNCSCVRVSRWPRWPLLCCERVPLLRMGAGRQMDAGAYVKYKFKPGKSTERPAWSISGLCDSLPASSRSRLRSLNRNYSRRTTRPPEQRGVSDKKT